MAAAAPRHINAFLEKQPRACPVSDRLTSRRKLDRAHDQRGTHPYCLVEFRTKDACHDDSEHSGAFEHRPVREARRTSDFPSSDSGKRRQENDLDSKPHFYAAFGSKKAAKKVLENKARAARSFEIEFKAAFPSVNIDELFRLVRKSGRLNGDMLLQLRNKAYEDQVKIDKEVQDIRQIDSTDIT
jgi:hypothetical protein